MIHLYWFKAGQVYEVEVSGASELPVANALSLQHDVSIYKLTKMGNWGFHHWRSKNPNGFTQKPEDLVPPAIRSLAMLMEAQNGNVQKRQSSLPPWDTGVPPYLDPFF